MSDGREALRVFISYARRDATAFADELLQGLEVAGFDAFIDRHDIAAGEDWEARLGGLIQSADTVVFVITPEAVASQRCAWEVARAEELSKRVIPIVLIDVPVEQTPERLRRLNYIYFTEGHSYSGALVELAKALRVDIGWIREHTRLGDLARRWEARDRADVLLLRGSELEAARAWLGAWKAPAPPPLDLHRAFIAASDAAEGSALSEERQRLRRQTLLQRGLAGVTALALVATLAGLWFVFQARRDVAETTSVILATLALDNAREEDYARGLRFALAASQGDAWYPIAPEVTEALAYNASALPLRVEFEGHQQQLSWARLLEDGETLVTASAEAGTLRAWSLNTGEAVGDPLALGDDVLFVHLSEKGALAASSTYNGVVRVWDTRTRAAYGPEIRPERDPAATQPPRVAIRVLDESGAVLTSGYGVEVWDGRSGRRLAHLGGGIEAQQITGVVASRDWSHVAVINNAGAVTIWDRRGGARTMEAPLLDPEERDAYVMRHLDMSDDGSRFATTTGETLVVWNAADLQRISPPISMSTPYPYGIELSPDGRHVMVFDRQSVEVWSADSGERTHTFPVRGYNGALFSPTGEHIAILHGDGVLSIQHASDSPNETTIRDNGAITSFRFSPSGELILTFNENRIVRLWRVDSGDPVGPPLRQDDLSGFSFLTEELVVTSNAAGAIRVWDSARFAPSSKDMGRFSGISVSDDGVSMLTRAGDDIQLWTTADGLAAPAQFRFEDLRGFNPAADHSVVLAYGRASAVLWNTRTDQRTPLQLRDNQRVSQSSLSLDGSRVLTSGYVGGAALWDGSTGALLWETDADEAGPEMSPRGDIFFVRRAEQIVIRSAMGGAELAFNGEAPARILWASFSPDGEHLIIGAPNEVGAWTSDGRTLIRAARLEIPEPDRAIFNPTSNALLVFSRRQANLWNLDTQEHRQLADSEGQAPDNAVFSNDGEMFLTWTSTQARIWRADGTPHVGPFPVERVQHMSFSPDGQRVAAASDRQTIIYNTTNGRPIATMPRGDFVGFSANSSRVVINSDTTRIYEFSWLAPRGSIRDLRTEICAALTAQDGSLARGASLRRITARDIALAPVLRGREGEDVCA